MSKRPIEIDDLLRLKRAERPPAEFWSEFDRQLRAKQLAAIMAKRPWWDRLPSLFKGFTRYHVPLGAAAVLAVTFIALREPRSQVSDETPGPIAREDAVSVPAPSGELAPSVTPETVSTLGRASSEKISLHTAAEHDPAALTLASEATSPGELSQIIPLLGAAVAEPAKESIATAGEYRPSSFAMPTSGEAVLGRSLLATTSFDARNQARAAIEPLQQITPPGERAHARFTTAMVKPVVETRMRTSDEIGSRLPEDRLYEQVRRFGARGAGLNIKL